MKGFLFVACAAIFLTGPALAISRYETMTHQCGQVQTFLRSEGAAILRWRSARDPSLPIYGRYVSDGRYCNSGEVSDFATVPTADQRACPVRKCIIFEPLERRIFIPD